VNDEPYQHAELSDADLELVSAGKGNGPLMAAVNAVGNVAVVTSRSLRGGRNGGGVSIN
jgi:hypothetical protein